LLSEQFRKQSLHQQAIKRRSTAARASLKLEQQNPISAATSEADNGTELIERLEKSRQEQTELEQSISKNRKSVKKEKRVSLGMAGEKENPLMQALAEVETVVAQDSSKQPASHLRPETGPASSGEIKEANDKRESATRHNKEADDVGLEADAPEIAPSSIEIAPLSPTKLHDPQKRKLSTSASVQSIVSVSDEDLFVPRHRRSQTDAFLDDCEAGQLKPKGCCVVA
jgi:hypothetical protein